MKYLFIVLVSLCFIESGFAVTKVLSLDSEYGIIFDDIKWECKKNNRPFYTSDHWIQGSKVSFPTSFQLFRYSISKKNSPGTKHETAAFNAAKEFLSRYAAGNNTIFSGLEIKKVENLHYLERNPIFVIRGSFVNNTEIGYFALYIKPNNPPTSNNKMLCMFVQIKDEQEAQGIDSAFQETFELLRPLIMD